MDLSLESLQSGQMKKWGMTRKKTVLNHPNCERDDWSTRDDLILELKHRRFRCTDANRKSNFLFFGMRYRLFSVTSTYKRKNEGFPFHSSCWKCVYNKNSWLPIEKLPADLGSLQMTNLNAYAGQVSTEIYIKLFTFRRITLSNYYEPFNYITLQVRLL